MGHSVPPCNHNGVARVSTKAVLKHDCENASSAAKTRSSVAMNLKWNDKLPLLAMKCSGPCSAVLVFVFFWCVFIFLTQLRFDDPGLMARMTVTAEILARKPVGNDRDVERKFVREEILKPASKAGLSFHSEPPTPDNNAQAAIRENNFVEAAVDVIELDDDDPNLETAYSKLDQSGKYLREGPLYYYIVDGRIVTRPPLHDRVFESFYIFEGVDFRTPKRFADARKNAKEFLSFVADQKSSGGRYDLKSTIRPWRLLEFFDPKRAILNDLLPLSCAVLMLVTGFILRYRYYDVALWKKDGKLRISGRKAKWISLWKKTIVGLNETTPRVGLAWVLAILCSIMLLNALEYLKDDPEIWQERYANIILMTLTGFYLPHLCLALVSLCCSKVSEQFRKCSLEFRGRVLRPLVISLFSAVLLAGWIIWFSYDQLISRGIPSNPEMVSRGKIQIVFALVFIGCCLIIFLNLIRGTPNTGPSEREIEKGMNALLASSCLRRFHIEIDEKFVLACALLLMPIIAFVAGALGSY